MTELEQTAVQTMPWSQMVQNPLNAWLATLPILFIVLVIYVIWNSNKREERLTTIIEGALKEITATLASVCTNVESLKEEVKEIKRGDA